MNRVAILGGYASDMSDFNANEQFYELPFVAVRKALDNLGLEKGDIDFAIISGYDHIDGRMISNMYTSMSGGGFLKYESRVSEDSTLALAYAYMKILSGESDIGVVVSYAAQETDLVYASNIIFDPLYYRPIGMNHLAALALQSSSYLYKTKLLEYSDIIASHIVSMNRKAGAKNPRSHLKKPLEPSDVVESEYVIWPLRETMVPPYTRGTVALIVGEEEVAKRFGLEKPIYIDSIAWSADNYYLGSKPLYILLPLMKASREAFKKGNVKKAEDIDLFEISDVTPFHYLMELEALGLSPSGMGAKLLDKDEIGPYNKRFNVNPSGGSLSTDPYPATGLLKVYESYLQLIGKAGSVQLNNVEKAVVHGYSYISGASVATHSLVLLSGV